MKTDPAGIPISGTIHDSLGIRMLEASPDRVVAEMEVGPRVHQPFGLLHGGASAVLAESAASIGAFVGAEPDHHALGVELNISHLRSVASGIVRATATPLRKGRSLQVWAIDLVDDGGEPVAVARCTVAIRARKPR